MRAASLAGRGSLQGVPKNVMDTDTALSSISAAGLPGIVSPDAGIDARIGDATTRIALEKYAGRLRAVVLTGSTARGEASFVWEAGLWRALGDAEFFLVFHESAALPDQRSLDLFSRDVEKALADHRIDCHIDVSPVREAFFRALPPHVFAYELQAHGKVVWGDPDILSLIPPFSIADIPLEDAWRMLGNRMAELLDVSGQLVGRPALLPEAVHYRTAKLYLDMATSLLLVTGGYQPSYRGRAASLEELAATDAPGPFPLKRFSDRVALSTEFKLGRSCSHAPITLWEDAIRYAHCLWRWELSRMTGIPEPASDRELMAGWMRQQPLRARARGWAYVVRKCGWLLSWRHWGRWARMGWRASPRYLLYAAASELFFQLPERLADTDGNREEGSMRLRSLLPLSQPMKTGAGQSAWNHVAQEIAWNYHEFLQSTRA